MASTLIETARVETLVQSGLPAADLEIFIDGADQEILRVAGPHDGSRKVVLRVDYSPNVYLPQPAERVSTVKEWHDTGTEAAATALAATDYQLQGGGRYIRRKAAVGIVDAPSDDTHGPYWKRNVAVTYTPKGDNARRTQCLIDLVKWELARSGHTRERDGQYESYQGTEAERAVILARLRQNYAGGGLFV